MTRYPLSFSLSTILHAGYVEDLRTALVMMLENDARNEAQLIEWMGVQQYLYQLLVLRQSDVVSVCGRVRRCLLGFYI